ncbi:hypothetical protein ACHQM5_005042 [Ranunculus cassubicifolius]
MLRPSHISKFSQSARSFLINGSRCTVADGNSSTCSEDENHIPRNQERINEALPAKKASILASKALGKAETLQPSNEERSTTRPNKRSTMQVSSASAEVASVPNSSPTSGGENSVFGDVRVSQKDLEDSSAHVVDHFVKAGIVAVGILSDLVNYKFPTLDGNVYHKSESIHLQHKFVLWKAPFKRECPESLRKTNGCRIGGLNSTAPYNEYNLRSSKSGLMKGVDQRQPRVLHGVNNLLNQRFSVDRVYQVLKQVKWGPVTEEALKSLKCQLDPYQILKQLQDHSVAHGFFHWLKRQTGFKHDGHSYTTMIGILGRARQFGPMNRLLDEMVRDGCMPNVVTYNRVIHSYGRARHYCTLIDIHAKAGFLDFAMDMYRRMQVAGLSPDTFTYSVMINCLGKAGLVTYNIMIAMQAKTTNYTGALKLYYRDMQDAGFQPDKVTYSIIMEVLGHYGYLNEAEEVFDEMKRKNWIPDEPVYGLLVDLWRKAGNPDKALAWYQAMLDAGLLPNVPTCNSLLSAFLRAHRFADAYNVLQGMLELGLQPSLQTYTLLLSCCTDTKSNVDMIFCSELMLITRHPAHLFLTSMPACGPDGQNVLDHASSFLDLMHSEDRESKRGLMDAVIDFLHKSGLKEEASSVWEVAAQRNVYPDALREKSSCYWLINLHVMSDGTAVTALSRTLAWFRRKMISSGVGPNRIDIVTGWGRRSRVTGSSLVRQSVEELLHVFGFPFMTENGNSGCFVGRGDALNKWLLQSYVERMHLI